MQTRLTGVGLQLRSGLQFDDWKWSYTGWYTISSGWHSIEMDWRASTADGAKNGGLTFWVDGLEAGVLYGLDNDLQRVDKVALGAIDGVDKATQGVIYVDDYISRRQSYIGP